MLVFLYYIHFCFALFSLRACIYFMGGDNYFHLEMVPQIVDFDVFIIPLIINNTTNRVVLQRAFQGWSIHLWAIFIMMLRQISIGNVASVSVEGSFDYEGCEG